MTRLWSVFFIIILFSGCQWNPERWINNIRGNQTPRIIHHRAPESVCNMDCTIKTRGHQKSKINLDTQKNFFPNVDSDDALDMSSTCQIKCKDIPLKNMTDIMPRIEKNEESAEEPPPTHGGPLLEI